ncbi:uncharacterized protein LOC119574893 [Penaeus monodon]|uniref:uncharacterized protein LOC119574893 n=1 Tax=Penaeus monodon TaxID=6687 RepID=UPI0018A721F4|nr:uncharacterized protein LOC119574893 [Penaeus monodon]
MKPFVLQFLKPLLSLSVIFLSLTCAVLLIKNNSRLLTMLPGPLDPGDPDLIDYVKSRYLHPPSTGPYNLKVDRLNPAERLYNAYRFSDYGWPELDRIIKTLFDHKSDGFFVEAGALDGEYLSNTLYLEREKGWKGLLVEPDEEMFRLLRKKNRKTWSIHSCLATKPYPMKTTLVKLSKKVNLFDDMTITGSRAHNFLAGAPYGSVGASEIGYQTFERVQCFPLQTILLALGVRHVDLVSLDIEGVERDVLRSFWSSGCDVVGAPTCVEVDVWIVESVDDKILELEFAANGYSVYTVLKDLYPYNYVFIKNGTEVHRRAFTQLQ